MNVNFTSEPRRRVRKYVKFVLGVSFSILIPSSTLCKIPWKLLFLLWLQTPSIFTFSVHIKGLCTPNCPPRMAVRRLCCKNKLHLLKTVPCHGDVRHHLSGYFCLPLATAPTSVSLVTLPASLVTRSPNPQHTSDTTCFGVQHPQGPRNTEVGARHSASWIAA